MFELRITFQDALRVSSFLLVIIIIPHSGTNLPRLPFFLGGKFGHYNFQRFINVSPMPRLGGREGGRVRKTDDRKEVEEGEER